MMKSVFNTAGDSQPREVRLERRADAADGEYVLTIDGDQVEIEFAPREATSGFIRIHGRIHRYYVAQRNGRIDVWLDGSVHTLATIETAARRAAVDAASAGPAGNAITAPMPGTILKLLAQPGDEITAHQPLVVMESMKMEMTLSAPGDGRVKDVLCRVGELVEMSKVLMKLEPANRE